MFWGPSSLELVPQKTFKTLVLTYTFRFERCIVLLTKNNNNYK